MSTEVRVIVTCTCKPFLSQQCVPGGWEAVLCAVGALLLEWASPWCSPAKASSERLLAGSSHQALCLPVGKVSLNPLHSITVAFPSHQLFQTNKDGFCPQHWEQSRQGAKGGDVQRISPAF